MSEPEPYGDDIERLKADFPDFDLIAWHGPVVTGWMLAADGRNHVGHLRIMHSLDELAAEMTAQRAQIAAASRKDTDDHHER